MVRANRQLTGAILLASYIAATIGAWSHGRHECREDAQLPYTSSSYACLNHGHAAFAEPSEHHVCRDSAASYGDAVLALRPLHEADAHHFDQCLICQFLAIQKVIELAGGSTPAVAVLTQRLVFPDHRLLVAERFGTPDSRGPPRTC